MLLDSLNGIGLLSSIKKMENRMSTPMILSKEIK